VVQIGNQCWMKSNLRTTHYSDGTAIPNGTGTSVNNVVSDYSAYYYQPNASSSFDGSYDFTKYNVNTYGLYYNWSATMHGTAGSNDMPSGVQGVCPTGWHVPSLREWDTLIAFVQTLPNATYYDYHQIGYVHVMAGGCEWEVATEGCPGHYISPVRNSSEFTAIPTGEAAGIFRYNKTDNHAPQAAFFWTSTAAMPFAGSPQSYTVEMYDGQSSIRKDDTYTLFGFSVRCVRDFETSNPVNKPTVVTGDATNPSLTSATLNGEISNPSSVTILAQGFKWKAVSETDYHTEYLTSNEMTYNLTGLTTGTEYTYFAFAIYDGGTAFGQEQSFSTLAPPTVMTKEATNVNTHIATLNATITALGDVAITGRGFEWKTSVNGTYAQVAGIVDGDNFTANLTGLDSIKSYTYRAYVNYESGTAYGAEVVFITKTPPTFSTSAVTNVGVHSATLSGAIENFGNVVITSKGLELKAANGDPVRIPTEGTGNSLTANPTNLSEGTTYTVRAYAEYEGGTSYGAAVVFTTKTAPTVTTGEISDLGATIATLNGAITSTGTADIIARGFKLETPASDPVTIPIEGTSNSFNVNLTSLNPNTSYTIRAYADYGDGVSYGVAVAFTTLLSPTVTTNIATNVTTTSATLNGTFTQPSSVTITSKGFEWKLCDASDFATVYVTGDVLSFDLSSLTAGTKYTYRAFVTFEGNTEYGVVDTFKTYAVPTVSTNDATSVTTSEATLNGSVTNPDDIFIVAQGFKYKILEDNSFKTISGIFTNENLSAILSELEPDTTYIFKAFVTYNDNTIYGSEVSFKTKRVPNVTTNAASQIGEVSAMLSGNITNHDNIAITSKGFQWKASSATNFIIVPVTENELTYNLTELTPGTNYSYFSYIVYAGGTIYGDTVDFVTKTEPTVFTNAVTNKGFYSATLNGTIQNVDDVSVTPIGFEWKASSDADFNTVTVTSDALTYNLTGLSANTSYEYKAFITHAGNRVYGALQTFSTLIMPTVSTGSASDIVTNAAMLNGTLINPDDIFITSQGFEYKILENNSSTNIVGTCTNNNLSVALTGLEPDTTYVFKAYITYNEITVYGSDVTFKTKKEPTVVTNAETAVGETTATLNGTVINPDGVSITKGFEWKPVSAIDYNTVYVTENEFTYNLTGLTADEEYLFRAFVVFDGKKVNDLDSVFITLPPSPSLSIISDASSTLAVCPGGSTAVTYTAKVEKGTENITNDYLYSWSVPSGAQHTTNGNKCIVIYTSPAEYVVTCTATSLTSDQLTQTEALTVSTASGTNVPTFATCEDDFTRVVTIISPKNVSSFECEGGTLNGNECSYTADGVYTIKAVNGNCATTKMVAIGLATTHPCPVNNAHIDGTVYTSANGGGLESVNGEGEVLTVQDREGNAYAVTKIGDQCWMRTNMRATMAVTGTPFSLNVVGSSSPSYFDISSSSIPLMIRGYLYNQYAASIICPTGWHLPSDQEWMTMESELTTADVSGTNRRGNHAGKLAGSCYWKTSAYYASSNGKQPGDLDYENRNMSGFSAVGVGWYQYNSYDNASERAYFWTSTLSDGYAYYRYIDYDYAGVDRRNNKNSSYGMSVRCVRNE